MKLANSMKRVMLIGVGVATVVTAVTVASAGAALVGHWNLDETTGTTASDSSGNANHGTLIDGPTWDTGGVVNGAIGLDGFNDRVHVADVPDLKYTGGNMTLSSWVYLDAGETSGRVISKPWNGSGRYNYRIEFSGTNTVVRFILGNANPSAGVDRVISSPSYPGFTEAWHHLAAVVDSSNNMTLYVDGSQAATGVNTITDWTGSDLNIPLVLGSLYPYGAGWNHPTNGPAFSVDGKIDDAAIWTDALAVEHVRSIFTVPHNLGLDYDVADMIDLWDIHAMGPGGSGTVDGIPWMFTSSLPDIAPGIPPSPGDAYVNHTFLYVALGGGTGLVHVPEPSTFALAAFSLFGLGFLGWRRRKRVT